MDKNNEKKDLPSNSGYKSDFSSDIQWRENSSEDLASGISGIGQDVASADVGKENVREENKSGSAKLGEPAKTGDRYVAGYQLLGKRTKSPRAKRKWLFKREESVIMRLVDKLVVKLYDKTKNGVLGHFFTSYAKVERGVKTSAILSFPHKISEYFEKRRIAKIKEQKVCDEITGEVVAIVQDPSSRKRTLFKTVVGMFEKSSVISSVKKILSTLFYLPMSTYGAALLSLGITTILVQAAKVFLLSRDFSISGIIIGIAYTLISMMTIFVGDSSFARYLCESKTGSFLLVSVFGVSKKTVKLEKSVPKHRFWAFLIGVALGLLSALVQAHGIFLVAMIILVAIGIAHNPESGVVMTIFVLPFISLVENGEKYLCAAVLYIAFVWIMKILGGQRRISFGALDGWMTLFAVFILLTGLVSADRDAGMRHAMTLIVALLGFFTVSNLLSSRMWMRRGINSLLFSGFIVSVLGVYEWILKANRVSWKIDEILGNEIASVFANGEILSLYLVIVFFFALTGITAHDNKRGKLFSLLVLFTVLVCTVLTMNIYAWVALAAVIMLYSLIKSKKNAAAVFGLFVILLLVLSLVSDILPSYLTGITDNGFAEKLSVMRTTAQMSGKYLISGIGLGDGVFENVYASLAEAGAPASLNGGSLFMELLIRFGLMGIVFAAVAMILVYRQAFSTFKITTVNKYASKWSVAAVSSLTAALLISSVSYIWSDLAMALLFWITVGFVSASRQLTVFENTGISNEDDISMDIRISSFRKESKIKDYENKQNSVPERMNIENE